eukprot:scaffold247_cov172-Ochromonas_danica.AAC.3
MMVVNCQQVLLVVRLVCWQSGERVFCVFVLHRILCGDVGGEKRVSSSSTSRCSYAFGTDSSGALQTD